MDFDEYELITTPGGLNEITTLTDEAEMEVHESGGAVNNKIKVGNLKTVIAGDVEAGVATNTADINAMPAIVMGFNGRNLQTLWGLNTAQEAFTALRAKSNAGDFSGLRLGDYIDLPSLTVDSVTYTNSASYQNLRVQIVSFDQYYRFGDSDVTTHHVLMQFVDIVLQKRMNATNTNAGGYPASELASWLDTTFKPSLISAIGLTPVTIHRMLDNHGDWEWLDETVFLPTEVEATGVPAWSDNLGYTVGTSRQYPLFALNPSMLIKKVNGSRSRWWTASTRSDSAANFCACNDPGYNDNFSASTSHGGVCPCFCI